MNPLIRNINYHYAGILKNLIKGLEKVIYVSKRPRNTIRGQRMGLVLIFWAIVTLLLYDRDVSLLHDW